MPDKTEIKNLIDSKGISVFFPAFNEEENINIIVDKTRNFLQNWTDNYEIIVVNDGSSDRTGEIIDSLSKNYNGVVAVHHSKNLGYGAALKSGFRSCTKGLIFFTDADNQFDINELSIFFNLIFNYDMVLGYRAKRKDPWMRLFYSKMYHLVILMIMHIWLKDGDCSFKLFRREVIDSMELYSDKGFIDVEIILKAIKNKFTYCEVPVTHYPRTRGKVSFEYFRIGGFSPVKPKAIIDLLKDMFAVKKILKGDK
jgi:glycosyltransferase involved in cell wall biosynthesis